MRDRCVIRVAEVVAPRVRRLEICGGIASGKTTLALALAEGGLSHSLEAYEDNLFWPSFYQDPVENAFETEISFLLQHYHGLKHACTSHGQILVCDYSILLDRAYALTTLSPEELTAFRSVYDIVTKRLPPPILIVHLLCEDKEEYARIARRGREVERTATLDLLVRLNAAIEEQLALPDLKVPILRIDSDRLDFREGGAHREQVVAQVKDAIQRSIPSL